MSGRIVTFHWPSRPQKSPTSKGIAEITGAMEELEVMEEAGAQFTAKNLCKKAFSPFQLL
jgi:hypothetical protein